MGHGEYIEDGGMEFERKIEAGEAVSTPDRLPLVQVNYGNLQ
jgi:hypothetical protein